jgi:hypothetical protein
MTSRPPHAPLFATLLTAVLLLTACGGGGDDTPATSTPEGAYSGTLIGSSSAEFQLLMLENNEFWTLYGNSSAGIFRVAGFVQGSGTASSSSYSSSNVKDFGFSPAASATLGASYNAPAGTISGTFNNSGALTSLSGNRFPASTYNYNTAASMASVVGTWSLQALTGETVALTLAANGNFTGSTSLACNFTGSLVPRSSGKNVFNLGINFGPAPCRLPSQTATGIGLWLPLAGGGKQLILAGTNAARTEGTAAFGTRP